MSILHKAIHRFNAIPLKIFTETEQSEICVEPQKNTNRQSNLRKKKKVRGIMLPDYKLCYKTTVIKTVWYLHKTDIKINGTQ